MSQADSIEVEVVYALPHRQWLLALRVGRNADVAAAIRQSGVLHEFPEIDLNKNKVGVFGKICALETGLKSGDRVEIYRPLQVDPKAVRKARADKKAR